MSHYEFEKQLNFGLAGEWVMDRYHEPYYYVEDGSEADDRRGIDKWYHRDGKRYGVQIKTDGLAQKYGNIIFETISVDTYDKPGWAFTSECDVMIFYSDTPKG
jgi:hypothetical protein